jgi:hypothetical protein
MGSIETIDSVLVNKPEVGLQNYLSEECEPVTLQVVLLGSDGIVIASDTCATNFNPQVTNRTNARTTEDVQKITIVDSKFVYMFAGDECAKTVGAAVARAVGENPECLSAAHIDEISKSTLDLYRENSVPRDRVDYREVIWFQVKDGGFIIWSAVCNDRDGQFVTQPSQVVLGNKRKFLAGDKSNPALYIVEHYYDKYPLRNVSSLKRLAAHAILTGGAFSANVRGLEMVVGNSKGFERVPSDEIRELETLSGTIHEENNRHFSSL